MIPTSHRVCSMTRARPIRPLPTSGCRGYGIWTTARGIRHHVRGELDQAAIELTQAEAIEHQHALIEYIPGQEYRLKEHLRS